MMLPGTESDRFRVNHICDLCDESCGTFKPKCYVPDDCDVEFVCENCHWEFCMCDCV